MDQQKLKQTITDIFKLSGLSIRSNGANYLCQLLEPIEQSEHEQWLDKVIETILSLPLSTSVINYETVLKAVEDVSTAAKDDIDSLLQIVDIFKIPRLVYNIERRKFFIDQSYKPNLHGTAEDKAELFKRRYTLVYQRTINHNLFRKPSSGAMQNDSKRFGLQKVEYLLGLSSREDNLVVLGLLTQLTERQFYLEDDTGVVKVDLSQSKFHTGLFTMNCFILLEGWFEDGVLHATAIGLPPAEASHTTRSLLGNVNYFGGEGTSSQKCLPKMQQAEREQSKDSMFVILSDVCLDIRKVVEKLEAMFKGYSQCPPIGFIFCGNFLSKPYQMNQYDELRSALDSLAETILSFPGLSKSRFIFVPGSNDCGAGNVFPRPPLPNFIVSNFKKKIPNSDFVSNPCRLTYCTQEIVIFREDIFTKMCRNSIFFPAEADKIASHFARTIVCEAHLSPLPLHTVPIYWGLDHCMSLHPTPDLIVIADKGNPFTATYNSCTILNPGSFLRTNFAFKVYFPADKEVEDSQIFVDTDPNE